MTGHHQANIHSGKRRRAHRKEHRLRRQEIRSLHIHILLRLEQDANIALHDIRPRHNRTARHYLYQTIIVDMDIHRRIVLTAAYQCSIYKIPIYQKSTLNGIDTTAFYPEMGIPPRLFPRSLHVSQGDIHAADEAHLPIYHAQFAVVAVVHLTGKCRESNRHKGMNINARITHPLEESILHLPAAHIIIDESHFHSLLSLVYQGIGYKISQGIIFHDIRIEMNMMLCLTYII